ncbi:site-specific integrase [Priestia aryabhattai]|uniref:tyrosine-type recombinase/integrase n=1 Tax=Priestia aryabhattai TaxID=412384 RepID=UPI001C8EE048|nr:site-specific integrase [Priestia aryabhattai]MBY0030310.1 site-specific integrase [Priestia aryabhattai]
MQDFSLVHIGAEVRERKGDLNKIVSLMLDTTYYDALEERNEHHQRKNNDMFGDFTDEEMMYYYVHQRKHIRKDRERKENTKTEYLRTLLQFYQYAVKSESFLRQDVDYYIEETIFKNLRPWHIRNYQDYLSTALLGKGGKPYSPATLDAKMTILKSFMKWLHETKYILHPLHKEILSTSLSEQEIPNRDLYYHEVKQLLDYYKDHPINHGLLTMLAMTGLRVQEIAKASWGDVYLDSLSGHYRLRGVGKGGKTFDKLLHPSLYERILAFRERRHATSTALNSSDKGPLFPTKDGGFYQYKNLSNYIVRIIERTELPFIKERNDRVTPHYFRHFYAIYSRQQGADIFLIQKELGHSDRKTTERYLEKVLQREQEIGLMWKEQDF